MYTGNQVAQKLFGDDTRAVIYEYWSDAKGTQFVDFGHGVSVALLASSACHELMIRAVDRESGLCWVLVTRRTFVQPRGASLTDLLSKVAEACKTTEDVLIFLSEYYVYSFTAEDWLVYECV